MNNSNFRQKTFSLFVISFATFLITGCRSPQKYAGHKDFYAQGRYQDSVNVFAEDMAKRAKKAGKGEDGKMNPICGARSFALDDLEIGAGYRAAQDFSSSNEAFDRAEQGIREQQEASRTGNASIQVAAILANDNALQYNVQEYDGIMVNTYKALNLLQLGEIDKARVEFRRVAERQRMAAENFKTEIAKAKEDEEAGTMKPTVQEPEPKESGLTGKIKQIIKEHFQEAKDVVTGSLRDGENQGQMEEYEKTFSADTWGAQEAFTNPFATYMQGLFLLLFGEDQSDAESAVHALATACRKETDPEKNPAAEALVIATNVANGQKKSTCLVDKVFVIFENGLGPERQQYTLPIIIPLNLSSVSNVKFVDASVVLPKLVTRNEAFPYLSVCDNGAELAKTVSVCNMDAVVAAEFRERMPFILFRNIVQSGVKAVLQVIIVDILSNQGVPRIAASAAVSTLFYLTKAADTRIWTSLPKNFQVAIVDRPASGKLQIMAPGVPKPIGMANIPAGGPALVFVHTPAAAVPPTVNVISVPVHN